MLYAKAMNEQTIRIIGFDPGLRCTGWGVIESDGVRLVYVASGVITPPQEDDIAYRLSALFDAVTGVIQNFSPSEAAVEEVFVNENPRSTLKLGQARGAVLLAPARLGLRVAGYTPNLIKKSVTGTGHAEKQQIQAMITFLLPKATFGCADEADALAIAITHAHHRISWQCMAGSTPKVVET